MSVALVDFSSLFHRLWNINRVEVESKIEAALSRMTEDEVILCLDAPPYQRKIIDGQYKANRDVPDPELVGLMRATIDKLLGRGYKTARCQGWEADDVIATIAASTTDESIVVYGTDKDLLQAVDLTDPFTGELSTAESRLGIKREQVVDYLAMVGDTSDNVKGIDGVGPKTAVKMLEKYGTLSGVLTAVRESPSSFTEKTSVAIFEAMTYIDRSREMVTLNSGLEIEYEQRDCEASGVSTDAENVFELKAESSQSSAIVISDSKVEYSRALEPQDIASGFRFAKMAVESGLCQQYKHPSQAMLAVMKGRAVGIDAVTSLESIHVISGKTMTKAETLVALIKRRCDVCRYFYCKSTSSESATWETWRIGNPGPTEFSFTIEDARQMGLTSKDNWKKQPATMLRWRAAAALARMEYPDVTNGIYGIEEFE